MDDLFPLIVSYELWWLGDGDRLSDTARVELKEWLRLLDSGRRGPKLPLPPAPPTVEQP